MEKPVIQVKYILKKKEENIHTTYNNFEVKILN